MSRLILFSLTSLLLIFIFLYSSFIFPANAQPKGGCLVVSASGNTCLTVDTAIGAISTDPQKIVGRIFQLVLGLSGGIALILIIISGYKFMTSGNNPESFQAAKDTLTSAIVGILFIIFSFVILQVIGVDILHIPGFRE